jgi:magnesium transporter
MPELIVCDNHKHFYNNISTDDISDLLRDPDRTVWLDLQQPTEHDIALLHEEFGFHPLAIEDATRSHERPKIDAYGKYYFLVLYAACYNEEDGKLELEALNLFVGPNYLVSVHHTAVKQIEETRRRWQHADSPMGNTVGALLYALLDAVVDEYFPLIDEIAERVEDLEDGIFTHFEEGLIEQIFGLKKDLLKLRRVVSPERDVMNVLLRREIPVFKPEEIVYLQDVYDHIVRVTDSVDTYRDLLSSALDSYLSLQSNRLNQIVKVLTIASISLMSSALIAGIYGMNFDFMPELHWRYGYAFALLLMVGISVGLIALFKRLKWL